MKSYRQTSIAVLTLFAVLEVPPGFAAQDETASAKKVQHHHYRLIDLGTLGGPASNLGPFSEVILNEAGTVVGGADTSTRDPNYPNFNPGVAPSPQDPFIQRAFQWQNGILADLGALSGTNSS